MSFLLACIILSLLVVHTCDSRFLLTTNEEVDRQVPHVPTKNVDPRILNNSMTSLKEKKSQFSEQLQEEHPRTSNVERVNNYTSAINESQESRGNTPVGAQTDSLVTVNMHKRRRRHPGFHIDYAPPRTHPPAHN